MLLMTSVIGGLIFFLRRQNSVNTTIAIQRALDMYTSAQTSPQPNMDMDMDIDMDQEEEEGVTNLRRNRVTSNAPLLTNFFRGGFAGVDAASSIPPPAAFSSAIVTTSISSSSSTAAVSTSVDADAGASTSVADVSASATAGASTDVDAAASAAPAAANDDDDVGNTAAATPATAVDDLSSSMGSGAMASFLGRTTSISWPPLSFDIDGILKEIEEGMNWDCWDNRGELGLLG